MTQIRTYRDRNTGEIAPYPESLALTFPFLELVDDELDIAPDADPEGDVDLDSFLDGDDISLINDVPEEDE